MDTFKNPMRSIWSEESSRIGRFTIRVVLVGVLEDVSMYTCTEGITEQLNLPIYEHCAWALESSTLEETPEQSNFTNGLKY